MVVIESVESANITSSLLQSRPKVLCHGLSTHFEVKIEKLRTLFVWVVLSLVCMVQMCTVELALILTIAVYLRCGLPGFASVI